VSHVRLPAALSLLFGLAFLALGAEPVRLSSTSLSLALDTAGQKVYVAELRNPRTGFSAIVPDARSNLWRIALRNRQGDVLVLAEVKGAAVSQAVEQAPDGTPVLRLQARRLAVGAEADAVDVDVTVSLDEADPALSRWQIAVTNRSAEYGVSEVQFPILGGIGVIGPQSEEDCVAYPQGLGRLIANPLENPALPQAMSYGSWLLSMQFLYYFNPVRREGLYLAAYDGQGYCKDFRFTRNYPERSFTWRVTQPPENPGRPGAGYALPYPVVVGLLEGDWLAAAKTYRRWACQQRWCRKGPLYQRADVPAVLKQAGLWPYAGVVRVGPQSDVMEVLASGKDYPRLHAFSEADLFERGYAVDAAATRASLRQLQAYYGVPLLWWCSAVYIYPFDCGNPIYATMKNMGTLVADLRQDGIATHPWTSAFAADMGTDWWTRNDATRFAAKDQTGALYPPFVSRGVRSSLSMCMATEFWRNALLARHRDLVRQGMTGVYIDLLNTTGPHPCFDPSHGHPLGGGHYGIDAVRELLRQTHDENRRTDPDFFTSGEEVGESYLDLNEASFPYGSVFVDNIPLFAAVYHDYHVVYSREPGQKAAGSRGGYANPDGRANLDELVTKSSQMFLWGNQLGIVQPDVLTYAPASAAFLRTLARVHDRARDYLLYGEFLPPARVYNTATLSSAWIRGNDLQRGTFPVIGHTAWRAPSGALGFAFVNQSAQTQVVDWEVDLAQYGLTAGERRGLYRIAESDRTWVGNLTGLAWRRQDVMAGLSAAVFEVGPAADRTAEPAPAPLPPCTVHLDHNLMEMSKGESGLVSVWVHSYSDQPVSGTIALAMEASWTVRPAVPFAFTVAPQEKEARHDFRVTVPETQPDTASLTVTVTCGAQTTAETWQVGFRPAAVRHAVPRYECPRCTGPITIDGDLADWPLDAWTPITLSGTSSRVDAWRGDADVSAKVYLAWSEDGLYLGAAVTDDVFSQTQQGAAIWQGDCMQVGLNHGWLSEYGLALCRGKPYVQRWAPENTEETAVRLAVKRDDATHQTVYEALFPASLLGYTPGATAPQAGDRLRLSFTVNEADADGFRGWLEWTPGICGTKNPEEYGELVLVTVPGPAGGDAGAAGGAPQNLLQNGDFEHGLDGWSAWPKERYAALEAMPGRRGNVLRLVHEPGERVVRAYTPRGIEVTIEPPFEVQYSFSSRRSLADPDALVIMIIGAEFADGSRTNGYCQVAKDDADWHDYRGTLQVPAGKALNRIVVWPTIECDLEKPRAAHETAWFDDVVIRLVPPAKPGPP
jgi:hypothetical protein